MDSINDATEYTAWPCEPIVAATFNTDMCYSIVNSRAFDGVAPGTTFFYKMSPWRVALYTGDAIAATF